MAFNLGMAISSVESDDHISSITTISDRSDEQQYFTNSDHASRTVQKYYPIFDKVFSVMLSLFVVKDK